MPGDDVFDSIRFRGQDVPFEQFPKLSCTAANQLAIETSDIRLDIQRKLLFQGDGQISAAGDMRFLTGSPTASEKLTILASGDVGIGRTNPGYKLDVNGIINATDIYKNGTPWEPPDGSITSLKLANNSVTSEKLANDAITAVKIRDGSVGTAELADSAVTLSKLAVGAVNTEKLADGAVTLAKLDASVRPVANPWVSSGGHLSFSGGNVGIGIAPVALLHIAGGNWNPNDTEGDLRLGDGTYKFKIGIARGGGGAGDVRLRAQGGTNRIMIGGGNQDALFIQDNDVSIPSGRLSFGSQTRQMINLWNVEYGIGVQSGTTYFRTGSNFCWFRGGAHNDARDNPGGGARLMALNEAGDLILSARTNPEGSPSKSPCRALVDGDKKLIINFANDYANGVEIGGTVRFGSMGGFTANNVDEWPNVVWYRDINAGWDEGLIKHASNKGFFNKAGFGIHIHHSRDWGIWTSGWTPLLGVEGSSGNVLARGSIRQASSRSLKENIDHLSTARAITALQELNPVVFNYRHDERKEPHLGFIAEDVPELVASYDRQSLSSMDIVAVLTKVVQDQQATIATLTERVQRLESQQG